MFSFFALFVTQSIQSLFDNEKQCYKLTVLVRRSAAMKIQRKYWYFLGIALLSL